MRVPGGNLLNTALRIIARQQFQYIAYKDRVLQPNGQYLANYKPAVTLSGSVQPVPRELYQQYGLDFQKTALNFYVSKDVLDVERDVSGDKMIFQCRTYQCESVNPWIGIDGWVVVMCVLVPRC